MNMLYKLNFITVHFAVINILKWFVAGMDGVGFLSQGGAGQGQKSTGQGRDEAHTVYISWLKQYAAAEKPWFDFALC